MIIKFKLWETMFVYLQLNACDTSLKLVNYGIGTHLRLNLQEKDWKPQWLSRLGPWDREIKFQSANFQLDTMPYWWAEVWEYAVHALQRIFFNFSSVLKENMYVTIEKSNSNALCSIQLCRSMPATIILSGWSLILFVFNFDWNSLNGSFLVNICYAHMQIFNE